MQVSGGLHLHTGTFSTVYKAEDLEYNNYKNDWDMDKNETQKWVPAARKKQYARQQPHYVAIKKIYVTSSPIRTVSYTHL